MSARSDYPKAHANTFGPHHQGQTSTETQQALDEIDTLRERLAETSRVYLRRVENDIEMMFGLLDRFAEGRADQALDLLLEFMDGGDTLGAHTTDEEWATVARAKDAYSQEDDGAS